MEKIVIIGAKRSPIGRFNGAFVNVSAIDLGVQVLEDVIKSSAISKEDIGSIYMGNVLQAGLGQNPARQVALKAGLSFSTIATTINVVCGSGMKSIELGMNDLLLGKYKYVAVGGMENMSQSPYVLTNARQGAKYNSLKTVDTMFNDGLMDAFSKEAMGITAENVAKQFSITREEQDAYALQSQLKAANALEKELFKEEITPIKTRKEEIFVDEGVRFNTTLEGLRKLRPAFIEDGSVTAGNSSTINDGASMLILTTESNAKEQGDTILGFVDGFAEVGIDPSIMGYAPYDAIKTLLAKQNLDTKDIDLFEINEAFASQSIAIMKNLDLDESKVNIKGGAIALGHPIGSSGARIVVSLLHSLKQENKHLGVASLCIGGGLGMALLIRRNVI